MYKARKNKKIIFVLKTNNEYINLDTMQVESDITIIEKMSLKDIDKYKLIIDKLNEKNL